MAILVHILKLGSWSLGFDLIILYYFKVFSGTEVAPACFHNGQHCWVLKSPIKNGKATEGGVRDSDRETALKRRTEFWEGGISC